MKKVLSLLLVLMMLLPFAAVAEEDYNVYVHPTGSYGFAYPLDWFALDKQSFDAIIDALKQTDLPELADTLGAYGDMIKASDMVVVVSPDGLNNLNVLSTNIGGHASAGDLLAQADALKAGLAQSMPGIEFLGDAEVETIGDYEYLLLFYTYVLYDTQMVGVQAYTCAGEDLYTFTLTNTFTTEEAFAEAANVLEGVLYTADLD